MGWFVFEIFQQLRPKIVEKFKRFSRSGLSSQQQLVKASVITVGMCLLTFAFIFIVSSRTVEMEPSYAKNATKCTKCGNYYEATVRSLITMYVLPALTFVCFILSMLSTHRLESEAVSSKKTLHNLITIPIFVAGCYGAFLLKKGAFGLKYIEIFGIQVLLLWVSIVFISSALLVPVFILRSLGLDFDTDYITEHESREAIPFDSSPDLEFDADDIERNPRHSTGADRF